jgi:hypothetical protein
MSKFFQKQNIQIVILIILTLGIFAGVYLTKQIQILMSKASNGLTLSDFIEAFGASSDEDNFNADLDINLDGKINVIDILFARKDNAEATLAPSEEEINSPEPTDEPIATPEELPPVDF